MKDAAFQVVEAPDNCGQYRPHENLKYLIDVCDTIIDYAANNAWPRREWFSITDFMNGVRDLRDLLDEMEGK